MEKYDHKKIEKKWQEKWREDGIYRISDNADEKKNFYQLVEFSYPSGNLHTGHWYAFAVPDIHARFKRMNGYNVLYPMGFDAFGLPAENAAIKNGGDPAEWTERQMEAMRTQLCSMGAMFDWSREVITCNPEYYKWTQWMFNQFLKHDLVYRAITMVNWCPKDQTILANEQVVDGCCERCGTPVVQREQPQWMLRITKYADRLIDDLDTLDWPEQIKAAQRNWIGRSEGSEIEFKIDGTQEKIKVFTTRADTLFGVTYVVLAPEHELVESLKSKVESEENRKEIEAYIEQTKHKLELERQQSKEKTGVELKGIKAINPANGEAVPIWIADYVLANYGTGAVMAVPAHDERDFEFAQKYNLPIKTVVVSNYEPITRVTALLVNKDKDLILQLWNKEDGKKLIGRFGGHVEIGENIFETLKREMKEEIELDINKHSYYFADYLDTHKDEGDILFVIEGVDVSTLKQHEGHEIIELQKYLPNTEGLSENTLNAWKKYTSNLYKADVREGILVNSSRFDGLSSEEARVKITEFVGGKLVKAYRLRDWGISRQRYWGCPIPIVYDPEGTAHPVPDEHFPWLLPTDVDHTPDGTAPLARSRELFERTEKIFGKGWTPEVETMDTFVDSSWYFYRYLDNKNSEVFAATEKINAWMPVDFYIGGAEHTTMHLLYSRFWNKVLLDLGLVTQNEPYTKRINHGIILGPDGNKMSKSKGNVVDPDAIVAQLGADTVRLYLAFMGPYEGGNYPWDPNGVVGVRRFLERVWKLKEKIDPEKKVCKTDPLVHKTIKGVGEDIEQFKFNTAISKMMILLNVLEKEEKIVLGSYKILLKLLAPFAPHIAEELWHELSGLSTSGEQVDSIHLTSWPEYNETKIVEENINVAVQVNGRVRAEIVFSADASEDEIKSKAMEHEMVKKWTEGKVVKRVVYVKGRLVNIVAS